MNRQLSTAIVRCLDVAAHAVIRGAHGADLHAEVSATWRSLIPDAEPWMVGRIVVGLVNLISAVVDSKVKP